MEREYSYNKIEGRFKDKTFSVYNFNTICSAIQFTQWNQNRETCYVCDIFNHEYRRDNKNKKMYHMNYFDYSKKIMINRKHFYNMGVDIVFKRRQYKFSIFKMFESGFSVKHFYDKKLTVCIKDGGNMKWVRILYTTYHTYCIDKAMFDRNTHICFLRRKQHDCL